MDHLLPFVERYGYLLLFSVGFVEYIGVPIASLPFLLVAGAAAARGVLHPVAAGLSIVLGSLLADAIWFSLARWRGAGLVDRVCGLTSNPRACVLGVTSRLSRIGPLYVLPAKLLPGTGNLIAPAAGFAGMPMRTFLLLDVASLAIWAGAYITAGWLLAAHVEEAVRWLESVSRAALAAAAIALVIAAGAWRVMKVTRHRARHALRPADEPAGTHRATQIAPIVKT